MQRTVPRRSLILDPIHPRDYRELKVIFACEDCSHFHHETRECTIGYDASKHVREEQERLYNLCGKVAFCRFCEID
ncbi:MAG TPA: hypothetical protein PKC28_02745 [Bdellovibrionales bacterium]|nr:hypothetical protein [Bdellovibrionales bacterium]